MPRKGKVVEMDHLPVRRLNCSKLPPSRLVAGGRHWEPVGYLLFLKEQIGIIIIDVGAPIPNRFNGKRNEKEYTHRLFRLVRPIGPDQYFSERKTRRSQKTEIDLSFKFPTTTDVF